MFKLIEPALFKRHQSFHGLNRLKVLSTGRVYSPRGRLLLLLLLLMLSLSQKDIRGIAVAVGGVGEQCRGSSGRLQMLALQQGIDAHPRQSSFNTRSSRGIRTGHRLFHSFVE